jgi:hypothetical protein
MSSKARVDGLHGYSSTYARYILQPGKGAVLILQYDEDLVYAFMPSGERFCMGCSFANAISDRKALSGPLLPHRSVCPGLRY